MNETFLAVLKHEGPVTIVSPYAQPAAVVNTWASYVSVAGNELRIPAAGMHSVEAAAKDDDRVTLTFGSKAVEGTEGPGAGFHVHGHARFETSGPAFDEKKAKFPWLTRLLVVTIDDIEQKI